MIAKKRVRLIGLYILSDVVAIAFSYFYSYLFRFEVYIIPVDPAKGVPSLNSYIAVFPLFLAAHIAIFYFQGFYKSRLKRTRFDDFLLVCLNAVLTIIFVQAVLSYLNNYSQGQAPLFGVTFKISHGFLAVYGVSVVLAILILRSQIFFFMKRRFARGMNLQNALIIGAGDMGKTLAQKLYQFKEFGFVVKGFLDDDRKPGEKIEVNGGMEILGGIDDLETIVGKYDISDVYVTLDLNNYAKILECLQIVNKYVVNVRLIPDLFQLLTLKANIQDLDGIPVISIDDVSLKGIKAAVKRFMDVVISALALLFSSPVLLIVAVVIKLTSKGPVFYKQERMGIDGRRFFISKFRTMVCDAEKETGPVMCRPDDPRMTKVGRFLRKYSIDEWPQFINVFKGEMSLIGPRPERPNFVRDFADKIPKYMLRHKVRAGLSGWAQVHGLRQDTPIDKRLEYDFYYIQNWSLSLDLKIVWMTLRKGFIDRSL